MDGSKAGLVVVGASLAGLRAVESARRVGYRGPITLIGEEVHAPYDRPPLSKQFLVDKRNPVPLCTEGELRERLGVRLLLGYKAAGLDPDSRLVRLDDGYRVPYHRAVIATGAKARGLNGSGGLAGVHTLRTVEDASTIREALTLGARVVVVGAGFIGAEIASSAVSVGATVTIVEAALAPLVRAVGEVVGTELARLHDLAGVRVVLGARITELLGTTRVTGVRLADGQGVPADVVVAGIGAVPATEWLSGSGVVLDPVGGGIVCDEFLRTSVAGVYAAGDVASWPNAIMDRRMRMENWTGAAEQGARAAINALFPDRAKAFETVPYFWSDWYGSRIQFAGTALAERAEIVTGDVEHAQFVALYSTGGRVVGAATLNRPAKIMKLRRLIERRSSVDDAVQLLERSPTAGVPEPAAGRAQSCP
ncbi:MAG: pyridine nucleotide-disulfide oxidoreductase [Amycolatopsis sp.]|uniref:NAD(P)/FAD-dependent oxidoreductase n=1 Tax=Amycolatopsis sp. TaxID=37632 RepID=UPI0026166927|nr:FAD-dependent oxidoreductase [Amycolatopsis sp.]MCU1682801.1 pyridine nucleotide-disulfide oxidoreductase [Amycolatopsis sp.]